MKIQLSKALFSILALGGLASVQAQSVTVNPLPVVNDDWRFSASINGWGSASSATLTEGHRSVTSTSSISQNLSDATAGALFSAEAHKGDWGMMADLIYWSSRMEAAVAQPIYQTVLAVYMLGITPTLRKLLLLAWLLILCINPIISI